jgi:hypothetical protein
MDLHRHGTDTPELATRFHDPSEQVAEPRPTPTTPRRANGPHLHRMDVKLLRQRWTEMGGAGCMRRSPV